MPPVPCVNSSPSEAQELKLLLQMGTEGIQKEVAPCPSSPHVRTQEEGAIGEPGGRLLPENKVALILDFSGFKSVGKKCPSLVFLS